MSHARRLEQLEGTASRTDNRGSYCHECGGLTIEDWFHAEDDASVMTTWGEALDTCLRCSGQTVAGALRDDGEHDHAA
jgi:hypothetical protein